VATRVRAARADRTKLAVEAAWHDETRERNELIASVNHELRTPLASIVGYTEVLLSGEPGPLSEEQLVMLRRVAGNGGQLLGLIEQLVRATTERLSDGGTVDSADAVVRVVGDAQACSCIRAVTPRPGATAQPD
jgi:signal transduction histidine kinase